MNHVIHFVELRHLDPETPEIEILIDGRRLAGGTLIRSCWGFGSEGAERASVRLMRTIAALALRAARGSREAWVSADELAVLVDGPQTSPNAFAKFMERTLERYSNRPPDELSHPALPLQEALIQYLPLHSTKDGWHGGRQGGYYRLNNSASLRVDTEACVAYLVGRRLFRTSRGGAPFDPVDTANLLEASSHRYASGDLLGARIQAAAAVAACFEALRSPQHRRERTILLATSLHRLGQMDMYLGASADAQFAGEAAARLFDAAGDSSGVARSYGLLADAHIQQGAKLSALRSAQTARDHAVRAKLTREVQIWAECLGALGQMESERANYGRARQYLEKAHRLHGEGNGSAAWAAVYATRLVQNALRAGDLREAEIHRASVDVDLDAASRSDHPDIPTQALVTRVDAHFLLALGKHEQAAAKLMESRAIGVAHGMTNHLRRLAVLDQAFSALGTRGGRP